MHPPHTQPPPCTHHTHNHHAPTTHTATMHPPQTQPPCILLTPLQQDYPVMIEELDLVDEEDAHVHTKELDQNYDKKDSLSWWFFGTR